MASSLSWVSQWRRPWLALCWLVVLSSDGAMASQTVFDVLKLADTVGIRRPYVNTHAFTAAPPQVFAALGGSLERRGAQILAADLHTGFLSWCDPGLTFVALPTHLRSQPGLPTGGSMPHLGVWHGLVYVTARLRPLHQGTWLLLHTLGREGQAESVVLSDGSYERDIFRDLTQHLNRVAPSGSGSEKREGLRVPALSDAYRPAPTALHACFPHLRALSQLSVSQIQTQGLSMVYPAPLERLWAACLDVIAQYAAIVQASAVDRLLVFTQGITLPAASAGATPRQIDVLFALSAAPRGQDGSTVSVVRFAPEGWPVQTVHDLKQADKDVMAALQAVPEDLAAALIVDRFFAHLTTQLFYAERWGDKLTRRHPVPGTP